MTEIIEIQTERLALRQWRKQDLHDLAKMNADPVVMEYYPNVLTTRESKTMVKKLSSLISKKGWGFWALELIEDKSFIGFVGIHEPTYDLPVTPCVEVGWRLAKEYWGKGYATEAASASLAVAFNKLNLSEVFSFASVSNKKSIAVMKRLQMTNIHKNFEHPIIPKNNPLREHVLYRLTKHEWMNGVNGQLN